MNSEWRPCLRPLRRELAFPEAVRGPVLFWAFWRLISARRAFFSSSVRCVSIVFFLKAGGKMANALPGGVGRSQSQETALISR